MRTTWCFVAVTVFTAVQAVAGPLQLSSISGSWSNASGGVDVRTGGSEISWGRDSDVTRWGFGRSGYNFNGADGTFTFDGGLGETETFMLGEFTHVNEVIALGTNIDSVTLDVGLETNGEPDPLAASFGVSHNETRNKCRGAGCSDDLVTIGGASTNSWLIEHEDGDVWQLSLLGFSFDGVGFTNVMRSPEHGTNTIGLYAQVMLFSEAAELPPLAPPLPPALPPPGPGPGPGPEPGPTVLQTPGPPPPPPVSTNVVPEPATLSLLGLGLLGLGVRRRR